MHVKFLEGFQGLEVDRFYFAGEEAILPEGTAVNLQERGVVEILPVEEKAEVSSEHPLSLPKRKRKVHK